MNLSSKPLTQAEATALEIAVVERKATIDDVRTVLDTDDWFAGCSIDELDPMTSSEWFAGFCAARLVP
jgi:hypothetical protein